MKCSLENTGVSTKPHSRGSFRDTAGRRAPSVTRTPSHHLHALRASHARGSVRHSHGKARGLEASRLRSMQRVEAASVCIVLTVEVITHCVAGVAFKRRSE